MTIPKSLPDSALQFTPAPGEMSPSLAIHLRTLTPARIALQRTGTSLATRELLDFQLAHARARDAVHTSLQPADLRAAINNLIPNSLVLHSAAPNRQTYLQRPDLGRKLDDPSRLLLTQLPTTAPRDISIVLVDGLSALAVERHVPPLLAKLLPALAAAHLQVAPVCIVQQGRVAIGDEIAHALNAPLVVVLIGERPGLSSPDSLGAYITWDPRPGRTDAERNCISNIRTGGLTYSQAAARLLFYCNEARRRQLTGVTLKEPDGLLGAGEND